MTPIFPREHASVVGPGRYVFGDFVRLASRTIVAAIYRQRAARPDAPPAVSIEQSALRPRLRFHRPAGFARRIAHFGEDLLLLGLGRVIKSAS